MACQLDQRIYIQIDPFWNIGVFPGIGVAGGKAPCAVRGGH